MGGKKPNYPTQKDKSRVIGSQDKYHHGETKGFARRFQSAADRHNPDHQSPSKALWGKELVQ